MIVHICLRTSGCEVSSRFAALDSQWLLHLKLLLLLLCVGSNKLNYLVLIVKRKPSRRTLKTLKNDEFLIVSNIFIELTGKPTKRDF
jgi:hypothetical protein